MTTKRGDHEFRVECEPFEVTSCNRPDPTWQHTDAQGHVHRWFVAASDGRATPAERYDPQASYVLPTLRQIVDVPGDDEYPAIWHYECATCGETVRPRSVADTERQFIPGLKSFYVDGAPVTEEDFRRLLREAGIDAPQRTS